jgi:hypothetical protein
VRLAGACNIPEAGDGLVATRHREMVRYTGNLRVCVGLLQGRDSHHNRSQQHKAMRKHVVQAARLPWTVAILSRTIDFRGDAVRLHRMPWTVHTLSRIEGKPSSLRCHAHVKLSSFTERPATHHDHAMAMVMRGLKTQVAGTTYTGFDEAHTLVCRVRASAINKTYHGSRKVSKWASTRVASSSGVNRFGEA